MSAPAQSERPLVSAIIACRNQGKFVAEAIESALAQEGVEVEVIVVDDGSTDDTLETLSGFGDAIRVIRNTEPTERGAARNRGAGVAKGTLLAFLDADDCWLPGKLAIQLPHALATEACVTAWKVVDKYGKVIGVCRPPSRPALSDLLLGNPCGGASTLMLTRRLFEEVGGFPQEISVQGSEDWLLHVRILAAGKGITTVPQPLLHYRLHHQQSTATASRRMTSMWAAVGWLETHGYVRGRAVRRLRSRTASVIAAGFAFEGRGREAVNWLRRAGQEHVATETLRALWIVFMSFSTGWLRRHGCGRVIDSRNRYRVSHVAKSRSRRPGSV